MKSHVRVSGMQPSQHVTLCDECVLICESVSYSATEE